MRVDPGYARFGVGEAFNSNRFAFIFFIHQSFADERKRFILDFSESVFHEEVGVIRGSYPRVREEGARSCSGYLF